MDKSDNEKDLILALSDDAETAVKSGSISIDAFSVRDVVNDLSPQQLDKYGDSLLYEAYFVAKKCKSATRSTIARNLGISVQLYDYYCETYPKFRTVIQMGVADAKDEMKESLINSLFRAAQGYVASDEVVVTQTEYNSKGAVLGVIEKISRAHKTVQPNVTAALELMKRLDPAWVPKVQVDVSGEVDHIHASVHDINVAVDYRKLSANALKELINSEKQNVNRESMVREVKPELVQTVSDNNTDEQVVVEPKRKRGRPKGSTKAKRIIDKFNEQCDKADKAVSKIAKNAVKNKSTRRKTNGKE